MHSTKVLQYQTPEELASAAAGIWLDRLRSRPPKPESGYAAAVSGGRIAANFFRAIARLAGEDPQVLAIVDWFWADERCVGPSDIESNYRVCRELLLDPLGIAAERVHRIAGELPPEAAASQADADWKTFAAKTRREPKPHFDMIFLGMGEDGHVASLFPSAKEGAPGRTYRAVTGPKPPSHRVTLGYAELKAATDVWVLASGEGKQKALEAALHGSHLNPLAKVIASRERTQIFTDRSTERPLPARK